MDARHRRLALLSAAACLFGAAAVIVSSPSALSRRVSPPAVAAVMGGSSTAVSDQILARQYRARLASRAVSMPRTRTVARGDSLSRISQEIYGSARYWSALYERNKRVIGPDPASIRTGMVLRIPRNPGWWKDRYKPPAVHTPVKVSVADTVTTSTPSGSAQAIAQQLLTQKGWGSQFSCLNDIIVRESGWRVNASNPSGAYGIPQALPGSKMGPGWQTSAYVQLRWMIDSYIPGQYGTPCGAWSFWQAHGWY